ncbi:MAG: hypothetical protein U9O59_01920 [Actinomycetota bacterium]|nr:hypothetical protein [Actinomycetota bacterium]
MSPKKKFDKTITYFVIGGAIIGAAAGYFVKKVGPQNIMSLLKQKDIIPPSVSNLINEFTSRKNLGKE